MDSMVSGYPRFFIHLLNSWHHFVNGSMLLGTKELCFFQSRKSQDIKTAMKTTTAYTMANQLQRHPD